MSLDSKTLLTFGALLHDIGKVVYRGGSEQGTHSKLGADYIKREVAFINAGFGGEGGDAIVEQIRYHHAQEMTGATTLAPDSLAWITYFADNISAGMDRKIEGDEASGAVFDRNAKLRKIFNTINGHHDTNEINHQSYDAIREQIKDGLAALEVSARGVNSLLNLLEATTTNVPSSTNTNELMDISLFDHAKTTAGIAACIYAWLAEQGINDYREVLFDQKKSSEYYSKPMFLLYSCDMSGIQNFIYNISGDGALKQLRARSFYLDIMHEHIADELLDCLQLSRANLMYTGGGHAYFLLPNTTAATTALKEFQKKLAQWFLDNYRIDLYMAAAWVECSADDLANKGEGKQRYGNLYRLLTQKLSDAKVCRYNAATISMLNFSISEQSDHSRECTECHRSDLDINAEDKCTLCAALGSISQDLTRKDVFTVSSAASSDDTHTASTKQASLKLPFDRCLRVWTREEFLKANPESLRIYTKNSWDTGIDLATHIWMGDYTADSHGNGIGAYAISGSTLEAEKGIKRLGVLRADVDNLGTIFTSGLPADKVSISRTATLSRQLSYFFKFKINKILETKGYQLQIIYSGGDDLFIVGNWSDCIHAAHDIQKTLDDFTGNGVLTISAGIGMFDDSYPIARMAYETGELEDAAKRYALDGGEVPTKNAVALWSPDTVFSWHEFTDEVQRKLDVIEGVFDKNHKGKAFIYKLISLLRAAKEDIISIPRLAYLLARSFEDDKAHGTETSAQFYQWATNDKERKYLIAALEWYVYETRERV